MANINVRQTYREDGPVTEVITLTHGDVPGIPFPHKVADLVVMLDAAELRIE